MKTVEAIKPDWKWGSFIGFLLALLAATVFAGASPVKAESQANPTLTPAVLQSPASKQGLNFVVGARGLESLSFNGQSLLVSPESGELQPQKSVFRAVLDALVPRSSSPSATPNKKTDTVDLSYPWGRISCAYGKQDDRLTMRFEVSNTSSKPLNEFSLRLMELNFPRVPNGGTLEAGMFGFGFKGPEWPLDQWPASIPSVADPLYGAPIVRADFGTGVLNFCSDDLESSVGIPHTTNSDGTRYPLVITCRDIKPGTTKVFNVSLRFGPAGAGVQDLSGDVLERYAGKYPFQVHWKDRRPIGAMFLAGPQINVPGNPRRWTFGEI
ncbi:MAG TPA: hypothetical protein VH229_00455, partial [Candidatus Udaeobacter sp.]|nr:hypothetical protein [Candidatus Udaeobacter sp.]